MAIGDIKNTEQIKPVFVWRKAKSGYTPTKGDPVSFDSAGDAQLGVDTHDGPFGMYTGVSNDYGTATTYYQVALWALAEMTMGGAVKPNKVVTISSASKLIALVATISATPTQAELQLQNRKFGTYVALASDRDSIYAASDAADTNVGIVWIGRY